MKVLLIGSGGREHALAWKLAQSPRLEKLFILPGNPGTPKLGESLPGDMMDLDHVRKIALENEVDLAVIGPESPLAAGVGDILRAAGLLVFGPDRAAAELEASKAFAKEFMARHGIPTAAFRIADQYEDALAAFDELALSSTELPVIKASGLAAGKGVILPQSRAEAVDVLRQMMLGRFFGDAGAEVIIEERLVGREVSVLAFTDGKTVLAMPPAQDHKRLLDDDLGPNTGGMGVFAPSPYAPAELVQEVVVKVLQPAVDGMRSEGRPFVGVIYAGILLTGDGFKVLEFNCRFGDPETQVILPLLDADLLDIMVACTTGHLGEIASQVRWHVGSAVCVILASGGYPEEYATGIPIIGLDELPQGILAFHAGTRLEDNRVVTSGGRVLGITAAAPTMKLAREQAYTGVAAIQFSGMHYRTDIALNM